MVTEDTKLLAIVGPTGSGKTDLSIRLAKELDGEIIAADSRTIYRGADIGTAKPSLEQRSQAVHWGLDMIELGERFTAHQFQCYANEKLADIYMRGKTALLVGGSGLYIDAVLYDFTFRKGPDTDMRDQLEAMEVVQLQEKILSMGLKLPDNSSNKRHLVRTVETNGQRPGKQHLRKGTVLAGIWPDEEIMKQRITARIDDMYSQGFIDEVKWLLLQHQPQVVASAGIGYRSCIEYIQGRLSLQEAKAAFVRGDWQYARRQRAWFKRNPDIHWFDGPQPIYEYIKKEFINDR